MNKLRLSKIVTFSVLAISWLADISTIIISILLLKGSRPLGGVFLLIVSLTILTANIWETKISLRMLKEINKGAK